MRIPEVSTRSLSIQPEDSEPLKEFYREKYTPERRVWYPTQYSWELERLLRLIDVMGRPVLDLGCGAGNLALSMAARGGAAFASDVMEEAVSETLENARALSLEVQARQSDALALWIEQGAKFDVIVCNPPCKDDLSSIMRPSDDPFSNSYLLVELLNSYQQCLNTPGCLVFGLNGRANMEWASQWTRRTFRADPFVVRRRIAAERLTEAEVESLAAQGLLEVVDSIPYWDAFFFVTFQS
jgi:SAM-dependent methyltransferase